MGKNFPKYGKTANFWKTAIYAPSMEKFSIQKTLDNMTDPWYNYIVR